MRKAKCPVLVVKQPVDKQEPERALQLHAGGCEIPDLDIDKFN
jgi:hypothetical protein